MPMTRARTSPPSGLLSCNVLAARARSRQRLDAASNTMANIIFQGPSIAHSFKFGIIRVVQKLHHPGSQGRIRGPDAPGPKLGWRSEQRFVVAAPDEVHRLPLAAFFARPVGASAS